MKRIIKAISAFILIFALCPIFKAQAEENHWYVKRNSEHKQPVCDGELSYVEDYGGIYLDKRYGDTTEKKVIYLTFDAGYENGNVAKILDALKSEGVKGSFFILGNLISKNSELVKRMSDEGHLVCNHTYTHKNLTGAGKAETERELKRLEDEYRSVTGREMAKFFRPPEGTFNAELLATAQSLGYRTVFWSFAYADWDNEKQMSESDALKKILDNVHNGEIMLLHPTSATNAKIIGELIRELKVQGYSFGTLDEI